MRIVTVSDGIHGGFGSAIARASLVTPSAHILCAVPLAEMVLNTLADSVVPRAIEPKPDREDEKKFRLGVEETKIGQAAKLYVQ